MNGAGNDFVVLDNRFYHFAERELAVLATRLCRRTEGVGADGLLALADGENGAHFRMHYHNADGSRATMCGNGARCLARYARLNGVAGEGDAFTFDTDAGRYHADVPEDVACDVRLHVPPARGLRPVTLAGHAATLVWTGTEHAVLFVDRAADAPVATLGPALRHDAALGARGANVNFAEVVNDGRGGQGACLNVRTFEKGVEAETRACGTGALAAALAARLTGRVASAPVAIQMPGGTLRVGFAWAEGDPVEAVTGLTLEGPAETTFRGTVELDPAILRG